MAIADFDLQIRKCSNFIFFCSRTSFELEGGIESKLHDAMKAKVVSIFSYRIKIFNTKKDYVNEFVKTHNMNFDYFKDAFQLILILNLCVIGLFVITNSKMSIRFHLKFLNRNIFKINFQ